MKPREFVRIDFTDGTFMDAGEGAMQGDEAPENVEIRDGFLVLTWKDNETKGYNLSTIREFQLY